MAKIPRIIFFLALCITLSAAEELKEGEVEEKQEKHSLSNFCKCAHSTLAQMQQALRNYTLQLGGENPPDLDDVIDQITDIAHSKYIYTNDQFLLNALLLLVFGSIFFILQ